MNFFLNQTSEVVVDSGCEFEKSAYKVYTKGCVSLLCARVERLARCSTLLNYVLINTLDFK